MKQDPNRALQRFTEVTEAQKVISRSSEQCDSSKRQYESFLKEAKEELVLYTIEQPVNIYFFKLLTGRKEYIDLWTVFRMVLVISHGQADVVGFLSEQSIFVKTTCKKKRLLQLVSKKVNSLFCEGDPFAFHQSSMGPSNTKQHEHIMYK